MVTDSVGVASADYSRPAVATPPHCILEFLFQCRGGDERAGIRDVNNRVRYMLLLACSMGCAVRVPRPGYMLTEGHNNDARVNLTFTWARYFNLSHGSGWEHVLDDSPSRTPPAVLRKLPESGGFNQGNRQLPTVTDLLPWLAQHPNGTLRLTFGPSRCDFWGSGSISEWLDNTAKAGPHHASCTCIRHGAIFQGCGSASVAVVNRAASIVTEFFGDAFFFALHLRRGDLASSYVNGCGEVPAVIGMVLERKRLVESRAHVIISGIFVLTDEREQSYLDWLRSDLSVFFELVRFESDVPERLVMPDDNYFNFMIMQRICDDTICIEHHPRIFASGRTPCLRVEKPFHPFSPPPPSEPPPCPPPPCPRPIASSPQQPTYNSLPLYLTSSTLLHAKAEAASQAALAAQLSTARKEAAGPTSVMASVPAFVAPAAVIAATACTFGALYWLLRAKYMLAPRLEQRRKTYSRCVARHSTYAVPQRDQC